MGLYMNKLNYYKFAVLGIIVSMHNICTPMLQTTCQIIGTAVIMGQSVASTTDTPLTTVGKTVSAFVGLTVTKEIENACPSFTGLTAATTAGLIAGQGKANYTHKSLCVIQ